MYSRMYPSALPDIANLIIYILLGKVGSGFMLERTRKHDLKGIELPNRA